MGIRRWWQRRRGRRPLMHLAAVASPPVDTGSPVTGPVAVVEVPVSAELLAPIAGVTVEQYVTVSKGVAAYNYDQAKLPLVAAELGIDAAAWATAAAGFNARVSSSPAFARHFNTLYRAARPRAS